LAEEVPGETDADADAVPVAPPNPFASLAKLKKPN